MRGLNRRLHHMWEGKSMFRGNVCEFLKRTGWEFCVPGKLQGCDSGLFLQTSAQPHTESVAHMIHLPGLGFCIPVIIQATRRAHFAT